MRYKIEVKRQVTNISKNSLSLNRQKKEILLTAEDTVTGNKPKILSVKIYGDAKNILKSPVWCHCSCEYFQFYLEVALTIKGSSSIINSTKQLPLDRNPRLLPYLCKHLIASVPAARKARYVKPSKAPNARELSDPSLRSLKELIP